VVTNTLPDTVSIAEAGVSVDGNATADDSTGTTTEPDAGYSLNTNKA